MQYCTKCVMPDTRPGEWGQKGGLFDEEGVCLACRNYERRQQVDWASRHKELEILCDNYRNTNGYDCVIPVSGGKDSHYLVWKMKEQLNMHPLLVNVSDPFTHTKAGEANLHNISSTFNCDVLQFRISEDVFRRTVRKNFEEVGHPLILVEQAIYTVPLKVAIKFGIPLLIQGEDPNYEYGTLGFEEPTLHRHYNHILGFAGIAFWLDRGFKLEELNCIIVPSITTENIYPIPMSYYEPWNGYYHMEIAKRYGFRDLAHEWNRESAFESFDQIDSVGWILALWLKFPKFGYSRATDLACRWIREGRITREEGIELVNKYDHILDQKVLDDFLDFTGYSVREFWDIVERFWNTDIFEKVNGLWRKKEEYKLR